MRTENRGQITEKIEVGSGNFEVGKIGRQMSGFIFT
jgi:hypothetical protein